MTRALILAVLLLTPISALALDESDAGVYAIVHRDGQITAKVFRILQEVAGWQVEHRKPDGSWENITCDADCVLGESKPADVERFLGKLMVDEHAECVHNKAFAFCRVTEDGKPGARQHLFIALTQEQPVVLKLARQDTGHEESEDHKQLDGFMGWILVTPDQDWKEKWNTPSDTTPTYTTTDEVKRGGSVFVLTFFANPKLDADGLADIMCDIEVVRPDGSFSNRETDARCFKGRVEELTNMHLSEPVLAFVAEPDDLAGEWTISIKLKDNVRKVTLPLKTSFVLVD